MAQTFRARLTWPATRHIPALGAAVAGTVVALAFVAMPAAWLEGAATGSGIAALLPVAEPPLGATARAVLALAGGVLVAAVSWAALYLLFGPGGPFAATTKRSSDIATPRRAEAPTVRRADAHPDAPPRWPLSAAELATPAEPSPPVEQPLPADLEEPLAAYDPHAVLPVPREPTRALKPLVTVTPVLDAGERLETFALTPPPPPVPVPASDEPPTIDALLRRLEQGAARRGTRAG